VSLQSGPERAPLLSGGRVEGCRKESTLFPLSMGSKKNKAKKALSSSDSPNNNVVDDDLVDDLLTELDSRNKTVQEESAVVLEEIQARQAAAPEKSGSKNRFRARQVRPFHYNYSSMVTSLSSRQGKPQHSLRSSRRSTPVQMRNWSGRPRKRSARLTGYATN
jgi:hypothetical protein